VTFTNLKVENSPMEEPISMTESSVTFFADPEELCEELPSYLQTAQMALKNQRIKIDTFEDFSHKDRSEANIVICDTPGFMSALHAAYACHYALELSVSDFIILIGQGLSRHIEKHAEKLRNQFVNHEGKEKIQIHRDHFVRGQQNDWSTVFGEFADEIKKRVKTDVYGVIIDDTSVATPTTRIVSEITLMDAMKSYFSYEVMTSCGIPQITLKGAPEDWQKLKDKVVKLVEMNKDDVLQLKWWLDVLVPVVDRICFAGIERKIDPDFWSEIYKYRDGSGGPRITGWIITFFPYLTENRVNSFPRYGVSSASIPKQICQVDFIWDYFGEKIPMIFYGGFLGGEFDKETFTMKPTHFWSVNYSQDTDKDKKSI